MFKIVSSCHARRCHPETCCCSTPYVVIDKNGRVLTNVKTMAEGKTWIAKVTEKLRINTELKEKLARLEAEVRDKEVPPPIVPWKCENESDRKNLERYAKDKSAQGR